MHKGHKNLIGKTPEEMKRKFVEAWKSLDCFDNIIRYVGTRNVSNSNRFFVFEPTEDGELGDEWILGDYLGQSILILAGFAEDCLLRIDVDEHTHREKVAREWDYKSITKIKPSIVRHG